MKAEMFVRAKKLRKEATEAERFLWKYLRSRQVEGAKFRRQEPIGKYIADFVCYEKKIVVEVDGGQHALVKEQDGIRDAWFKKEGFEVLRFWNNEVLRNINGVLDTIRGKVLSAPSPNPLPSREGVLS